MKRRSFLQSVIALALAPILPRQDDLESRIQKINAIIRNDAARDFPSTLICIGDSFTTGYCDHWTHLSPYPCTLPDPKQFST